MAQIRTPPVHRVALVQLALLALISALLLVFDWRLAASAALGGIVQILPQAWFARQAFRYIGARQTRQMVRAMYRGMGGKLLLTAALFVSVFKLATWVQPVVLFISFGVMILVQLLGTARIINSAH